MQEAVKMANKPFQQTVSQLRCLTVAELGRWAP